VADGCIDIFFEFNDPSENFVMGFCRKYTEFPLDTPFNYVGIRFLPTVFPQFYGIDASEISNRFEHLSVVVPETSEFLGIQLNPSQTMEQIRRVLDDYFLNSLAKAAPSDDNRLYKALHTILENQGDLNVETDIDAGISPRQLRRIFKYYIGDTAKTFSKVVQFQNILRAKPSGQSLIGNKLFYDVGYYDQSHFIKDFKKFYGVTPSRAFAR
jgi:AraC-like DNA-binding protein